MNARNDVKKPFHPNFNPGPVLAAVRLRLAARLDFLVARWLARCAANIEAAQELFKTDRRPSRGFGMGLVSSPRWDELP
jgi:hypothetical protein